MLVLLPAFFESPFLHVAQSLLLKCNGLSVRCMQSVNERCIFCCLRGAN